MSLSKYNNKFVYYIEKVKNNNLHPYVSNYLNTFPKDISKMPNLILYGPSGIGKYSQMLYIVSKYSPSSLKYERKFTYSYNKQSYLIKMSDIHFEIDMALLGCNSKVIWNEMYTQIIDIIMARSNHTGIIVCKNFQDIHSELLDIFYSYMQSVFHNLLKIKFILISENISCFPNNIINNSKIINLKRLTKTKYKSIIPNFKGDVNNIINIKNINYTEPHIKYCNEILEIINNSKTNVDFKDLREKIYNLFTYNIDIHKSIFYILINIINKKQVGNDKILTELNEILFYYNNNYRPIYHLEKFILNLIEMVE